jgi:uncharacterized DUF497 family protein
MEFEWNNAKNEANVRKHGVSFEQASAAFVDTNALDIFDDLHSGFEDRFITIGRTTDGLALVVWTERADGAIRIIPARWATKREARRYHRELERKHEQYE